MSDLAPALRKYFHAGLAASTHRTYSAGLRKFYEFCSIYNLTTPFPISELHLCYFVAFLAEQDLAPSSCSTYLAAVRNAQIALGLPEPREHSSLPLLKRVLSGIRRCRLQQGKGCKKTRLPVTVELLKRMKDRLDQSSDPDKVVLWAVACTAFFGFFRLGELLPTSPSSFDARTDLAWGDVAVDDRDSPTMVQVHLKTSKVDQFGQGVDVVLGRTGVELCPVQALTDYLRVRGSSSGPFFLAGRNRTLTKAVFVHWFRAILREVGVQGSQFAGHSFRIGAATTAAVAGIEDSMIQTMGRWHSAAFLTYIRSPKQQLASMSARLVQPS